MHNHKACQKNTGLYAPVSSEERPRRLVDCAAALQRIGKGKTPPFTFGNARINTRKRAVCRVSNQQNSGVVPVLRRTLACLSRRTSTPNSSSPVAGGKRLRILDRVQELPFPLPAYKTVARDSLENETCHVDIMWWKTLWKNRNKYTSLYIWASTLYMISCFVFSCMHSESTLSCSFQDQYGVSARNNYYRLTTYIVYALNDIRTSWLVNQLIHN